MSSAKLDGGETDWFGRNINDRFFEFAIQFVQLQRMSAIPPPSRSYNCHIFLHPQRIGALSR